MRFSIWEMGHRLAMRSSVREPGRPIGEELDTLVAHMFFSYSFRNSSGPDVRGCLAVFAR